MKIIFFTARGSETGKNWENLTKNNLQMEYFIMMRLGLVNLLLTYIYDDKAAVPSICK